MIKLKSAHIEELRGIRKLTIDFNEATFVISGPNGSGKSGVIDAIEFGLTGEIGRLTGKGTKELTLAQHGAHVDKINFPDAAFVELQVSLPLLGKTATITRKLSSPKKPKIVPSDSDVVSALKEIANHPEVTLSRREILRFILVESSTRSEEIQSLLKLDKIGDTRAALYSARTKLSAAQSEASRSLDSAIEKLLAHFQIPTLSSVEVLNSANKRRKILGVPEIAELTDDSKLDAGLSTARMPEFNKVSSLRDLSALMELTRELPSLGQKESGAILEALVKVESDPSVVSSLKQRALVKNGLDLVESASCPLCGHLWEDEKHLREHLNIRLSRFDETRKLQEDLLRNGSTLIQHSTKLAGMLGGVEKIATGLDQIEIATQVSNWKANLDELKKQLENLDGLIGLKARLESGWLQIPKGLDNNMEDLKKTLDASPDQTSAVDAHTFLVTAQERLSEYREAKRKKGSAEVSCGVATEAYDVYCSVMEEELNTLYQEVQEDFSTLYRAINGQDEENFTAKFTPHEGKLDFSVNFYERGLFPPGAYHSEGHQDGMGVCLYLALMKRLFGDQFTFALLDDVVMSVDTGHRYEFCKLLKTHFPNTQFIITTHDRLWAEQMRSAGLVTSKTFMAIHSWTIDTGPLVESSKEIWEEIADALAKGKVETAAAALRHHLEYISRLLADQLGATPVFRSDGNYDLGDLLPSVLSQMKKLLGEAADAAQSWKDDTAKTDAGARKAALSTAAQNSNVEQWAINKGVHYNEWANFGRKDFEPVVGSFKELLKCFKCEKCDAWLYVSPHRSDPDLVRCMCNKVNLNLKKKPKK